MSSTLGALLLAMALPQSPQIDDLQPPGARRGGTIEVELRGQRLEAPQGFLLETSGIEVVAVAPGDKPERCRAPLPGAPRRAAPDCALGAHTLRLRTATGLGNPVLFHVGALPELVEQRDGAEPMALPLDHTVNGSVGNEESDRYRVTVPQGATVRCEVVGVRLGRRLLDLVLTVLDPAGAPLARSDDSALGRKDPVLAFTAATAGDYTLVVQPAFADPQHAGAYRLHVGTFPRPTGCLPCGGAPGATLAVQLLGDAALPATPVAVTLPADATDTIWAWHPEVAGVPSPTPVFLRVGGPPDATPAPDAQGRTWVTWPASVCGVVAQPGEPVRFHWKGEKGKELEFRCFARSLRSPLDAVLLLRDGNGRFVASNDDSDGLDPVLRVVPPADGDYVLEVRDVLRRGSADRFFRLEGAPRRDTPSLRMVVGRREDAAVVVPRGGHGAAVLQWNGFDAKDRELLARALPAGVSARCGPLLRGSAVPVLFTADAEAPLGANAVDFAVRGPGAAEQAAGYRQQLTLVTARNDQPLFGVLQPRLPVAVAEAAPFTLTVAPLPAPLVRNAPLAALVHLVRRPGWREPVTLRAAWTPPGVSAGTVTLDGAASFAVLPLSADGNAATGTFPLLVVGDARVGGGTVTAAADFASVQVDAPWLTARGDDVRSEPGRDVDVKVVLTPAQPLPADCRIGLLGLPRGVSAAPITAPAAGGELTLRLQCTAAAPPGRHRGVLLQVLVPLAPPDAGPVPVAEHRFPFGELRLDAPLATAPEERR